MIGSFLLGPIYRRFIPKNLKPVDTMPSLIAWLETKDPTETYRYGDAFHCLAAQYHRAVGTRYNLNRAISDKTSFYGQMEKLAHNNEERTFGGALKMLKESQKL